MTVSPGYWPTTDRVPTGVTVRSWASTEGAPIIMGVRTATMVQTTRRFAVFKGVAPVQGLHRRVGELCDSASHRHDPPSTNTTQMLTDCADHLTVTCAASESMNLPPLPVAAT